jgi:hypothetical protein
MGSPVKSNLSFWWDRSHEHLANGGENGMEFGVVTLFHFRDLRTQVFVSGEHGRKLDKGTDDGDVYADGSITPKNAREHRHTVFSESVWTIATAATRENLRFQTGTSRRPDAKQNRRIIK